MPDPTVPSAGGDMLARLHQIASDLVVELDALDNGAGHLDGPLADRIAASVHVARYVTSLVVADLEQSAAGLPLDPIDRRVVEAAVEVARGLVDVDLDDIPVAAQAAWARQCRPVLAELLRARR